MIKSRKKGTIKVRLKNKKGKSSLNKSSKVGTNKGKTSKKKKQDNSVDTSSTKATKETINVDIEEIDIEEQQVKKRSKKRIEKNKNSKGNGISKTKEDKTKDDDVLVEIVGEKANRKNRPSKIQFCRNCDLPIAIYAWLDPCCHLMCMQCGEEFLRKKYPCPLCQGSIMGIIPAGSVTAHTALFPCGVRGCFRVYFSSETLSRHIDSHAPSTSGDNLMAYRTNEYSMIGQVGATPMHAGYRYPNHASHNMRYTRSTIQPNSFQAKTPLLARPQRSYQPGQTPANMLGRPQLAGNVVLDGTRPNVGGTNFNPSGDVNGVIRSQVNRTWGLTPHMHLRMPPPGSILARPNRAGPAVGTPAPRGTATIPGRRMIHGAGGAIRPSAPNPRGIVGRGRGGTVGRGIWQTEQSGWGY